MKLRGVLNRISPLKIFALTVLLCSVLLPPSGVSRIISVTADVSSARTARESVPLSSASSSNAGSESDKLFGQTNLLPVEIAVYMPENGAVVKMELEDYTVGVTAAEMGAQFGENALKAQAIAARSFALYEKNLSSHPHGADVCTDFSHCQAYVSRSDYSGTPDEWEYIKRCAQNTAGIVLTYEGSIAHTLYHDSSPAFTESIENVWPGQSVPYLVSVPNYTLEGFEPLSSSVTESGQDFTKKLLPVCGSSLYDGISVSSFVYSPAGRVISASVNGITVSGTRLRTVFSLNSACFTLEELGGSYVFAVDGNGHGVGMSQRGAHVMSEAGFSCEEILKHYYRGCVLTAYASLQP